MATNTGGHVGELFFSWHAIERRCQRPAANCAAAGWRVGLTAYVIVFLEVHIHTFSHFAEPKV